MDKGVSLGTGAVLAGIGLIITIVPGFVMSFFTMLIGLCFLVTGISILATWARGLRFTPFGMAMLPLSITLLILGFICLLHPLATASSITWLVALCVLIAGIVQLVALWYARDMPQRNLGIITSALVIIFGVLALASPSMIVRFVGVAMLIEGVSLVITGLIADRS